MAIPDDDDDLDDVDHQRDRSVWIGIDMYQKWTLATVLSSAVAFGIWFGTLNSKLDRIEKFVDAAQDNTSGVFIQLKGLQDKVDMLATATKDLTKNSVPTTPNELRSVTFPPIEVKIPSMPPIEVQAPPSERQSSPLDKWVDFEIARKLESEKKESENGNKLAPPPVMPAPVQPGPSTDPQTLARSEAAIKTIKAFQQQELDDLETTVSGDKHMAPQTKETIRALIDSYRAQLALIKP